MPSIKMTLDFDSKTLGNNLESFGPKVDGQIHAVMDYQSTKALSHMRTTAPWRDRTGNARSGLSTQVLWKPMSEHVIRLFHRVPYGIYLETRWAGRYSVILPTIQRFGPDTMRLLQKLFNRLGPGGA